MTVVVSGQRCTITGGKTGNVSAGSVVIGPMTNCLACRGMGRFVVAYDSQALPSDVRPCPYCGGKGVVDRGT